MDFFEQLAQADLINGVLEQERAVEQNNGDLLAVIGQQAQVILNVDILQLEGLDFLDTTKRLPRIVAQVTAGFGIKRDYCHNNAVL